jgi:hypothetical protein
MKIFYIGEVFAILQKKIKIRPYNVHYELYKIKKKKKKEKETKRKAIGYC